MSKYYLETDHRILAPISNCKNCIAMATWNTRKHCICEVHVTEKKHLVIVKSNNSKSYDITRIYNF
jgi:hypothetical protein